MIAQRGGKILEHFELFDIYEGDQIEKGFKSVAYSLTFRSKEKTLEEAEINRKPVKAGLRDRQTGTG